MATGGVVRSGSDVQVQTCEEIAALLYRRGWRAGYQRRGGTYAVHKEPEDRGFNYQTQGLTAAQAGRALGLVCSEPDAWCVLSELMRIENGGEW